jgi:LasA protease
MHKTRPLVLLLILLPALACNLPQATSTPPRLNAPELRQTLNAQDNPSETPPTLTASGAPPEAPATSTAIPPAQPSQPVPSEPPFNTFSYHAQPGDTLPALARRFGVETSQITSPQPIPVQAYIQPEQLLVIPNLLGEAPNPLPVTSQTLLMPDSEVVYSPSSVGFSIQDYLDQAGGYLGSYQEEINGEAFSGAQVVQRVASETSTNPRLLLALVEYRSGWVRGGLSTGQDTQHPLELYVPGYLGLYAELSVIGKLLNIGYYGWRSGELTEIQFKDGKGMRLNPELNAGSAALLYLFARLLKQAPWQEALNGKAIFPTLYDQMFGDPWERAAQFESLLPADLGQPVLELPFQPGERWSLTAGPHQSWNTGTPLGALDFAPATGEAPCSVSKAWATASAAGIVVRSGDNSVVIDLDGDGYEQTGWVLFYYHLSNSEYISAGERVKTGDHLGHPSCEGGVTTGTHVHIARKYNGEWIPADGPVPFVLSGWQAHAGPKAYQGELVKDGQVVRASPAGIRTSIIVR